MKNVLKIFILISLIFSLSNCVDESEIITQEATFFDLKEYFTNQSEIQAQNRKFLKATSVDDNRIEKKLDSLDFMQELKVFAESDINKVAWLDKYLVDTTFNLKGDLTQLLYKAVDEKLRTQELKISFSQNEVDTIEIYNNASGNVAKLEQRLLYIPSYGYSIKSKQKTTFSEEHVVTVDVRFLEK